MASNDIPLSETKILIKSLILTRTELHDSRSLNDDFKANIGFDIPYRRYGYSSLEYFLSSLTDILSLERKKDGNMYVVPRLNSDNKSQHISDMVSKQKKTTKPHKHKHRPATYSQASNRQSYMTAEKSNYSVRAENPNANQQNFNNTSKKTIENWQPLPSYKTAEKSNHSIRTEKPPNANENTSFNNIRNNENFQQLNNYQEQKKMCSICLQEETLQRTEAKNHDKKLNLTDAIVASECRNEFQTTTSSMLPKQDDIAFNIKDFVLPSDATSKKIHHITITHTLSPHRFWFRFKDMEKLEYNVFMSELNEFCSSNSFQNWRIQNPNINTGNICCVNYSNGWYRAKFLSKNQNSIEVFLLDIGNIVKVRLEDVRYLPKQFSFAPRQAFRGSLEGIQPKDDCWSFQSMTIFYKMCCTATIKANIKFVDDNIAYILAFDNPEKQKIKFFNEIMVENQLAIRNETNIHFQNKFPSFEMIEEGEYPSHKEIYHIIKNFNVPFISNQWNLLKNFKNLNCTDLKELFLHFKSRLQTETIEYVDHNCKVYEKIKQKQLNSNEAAAMLNEKILKWVANYNKKSRVYS